MDRTYIAQVEKHIRIVVKPGRGLTENSIKDFNRLIYHAGDTIEEHYANIAKMIADDRADPDFIEGYGNMKELGIEILIPLIGSEAVIEEVINN